MKHRIINIVMILIAIGLFNNCKNENDFQTKFLDLNGNSFVMQVDRQANDLNVQYPSDEISELSYTSISPIVQHSLSFSNDGQLVTIIANDQPISGQLQKKEFNLMSYYLTEGLFADGRFNIWTADGLLQFEYTIYGSGRPIIFSGRGTLIPVE